MVTYVTVMQTTKNLVQRLEDGIARVRRVHPQLPVEVVRVVRLTDLLSRVLFARLDAFLAGHGLTDTSWLFLTSIYTAPGGVRSPSEVGRVLVQSKPHMTRLADTLLAKGLIRRAHSEEDRRRVVLAVTSKGRRLVEGLLPQVWAQHQQIANGLSRTDLARLSVLLAKWLSQLDRPVQEPISTLERRTGGKRSRRRAT
jgi:MarR family transcriptional regulator, negative regulator of the multidrug operon emrRAB